MNTWKKLLIISGMCSLAGVTPAFASTNLETGSSLAGISVALNNYYAGNAQPEKKLASSYDQLEATAKNNRQKRKPRHLPEPKQRQKQQPQRKQKQQLHRQRRHPPMIILQYPK